MKDIVQAEIRKLAPTLKNCEWENPSIYGAFVAQTYYYVCHSTRLLGLAASHFQVGRDALHRRFAAHMAEEKSHERLALMDVKNLGFDITDFAELSETRAFYESQYYKIQYQGPTSLFGYILMLEVGAVQLGRLIYEPALKSHGPKCTNFMRVHVEEDPDHVEKALEQIESLPKNELVHIETNLIQSAEMYAAMINKLAFSFRHEMRNAA